MKGQIKLVQVEHRCWGILLIIVIIQRKFGKSSKKVVESSFFNKW